METPETKPTDTPGMALSVLSMPQRNLSVSSSGGFDFGQIGNFIKDLMQGIANLIKGSSSLTVLGNDGGNLTNIYARMTDSNPQVAYSQMNGPEANLGPALNIGQQQVAQNNFELNRQNRNTPGMNAPSYSA